MDKQLIKYWLINRKPKIYTIIVACYIEKLTMLQTALFIEWLSLELDVPLSMINKASISSALRRYRKKMPVRSGVERLEQQAKSVKDPFNTTLPHQLRFE